MAIQTYTQLKEALEDWLDDDDVVDRIDDFIALAEARHKRQVRIKQMIERCPISVVNRYVALPSLFIEASKIRLLETPIVRLTQVNSAQMDVVRREISGTPKYFTADSEIEFDVSPDRAYNGEMKFYKELRPLSDSTSTNSLLKRAPDIYLYSALAAAAPFVRDDDRVDMWEKLYTKAKDDINELDQKTIGVPVAKVVGLMP